MASRFEHHRQDGPQSLLALAHATQRAPLPMDDGASQPTMESPASPRPLPAIAGLTVAGAVLGAALALAWPTSYVATSEMMVDPVAMQLAAGSVALSPQATQVLIDNQIRLLHSAATLNEAVDRLNLAADAEFNGDAAGPFGLGGALTNFGDLVAGDGANAPEQRRRRAVETLSQAVEARRVPGSPVVSIAVRTADPEKSALIANTVSELFLGDLAHGSAGTTTTARLEQLRADLSTAERAVASFRKEAGLPEQEDVESLDRQLAAVRARATTLTAQAETVQELGLDRIMTGSIAARPVSPALEAARMRHAGLKQQVDSLATKLGPRHPDLVTARAELESARREVESEAGRAVASVRTELSRAVQEEQNLAAQIAGVTAQDPVAEEKRAKLNELERDAETRRTAYERALRASDGAAPAGAGRVISSAHPPLQAAGPSTPALTLGGALGGLLAGLGLAGWRRQARESDDDGEWDIASQDGLSEFSDTEWDAETEDPSHAPLEAKEAEAMYPYPPYAAPAAPGPGYAQPEPAHAAHYYPHAPMPAAMPAPAFYPAPPQDPWAHLRPYTPQPYGQPPVQLVYVPVPALAPPASPQGDSFSRDRYIDRHTDAAIEEIRQSLRALRTAIEDFADDRYGT